MPDLPVTHLLHEGEQAVVDRLEHAIGGPARMRVVVLLGLVLALESADTATVGAIGSNLESGLHIGNTQLGLLAAVAPLVGALTTIPAGMLADRAARTRVLWVAIVVWSAAMLISAASVSYTMLLLSRLALGAVVAAAGPNVASLTGDLFPAGDRGRIYGFILAGELLGAAFGFLITGEIADAVSWRASFVILAIPGFALAWAIRSHLTEPARGGQSRLEVGATEIRSAEDVEGRKALPADASERRPDDLVQEQVRRRRVRPRREVVLTQDPARMSVWQAGRYVLSIPSVRLLIVASALGYYFFSGLETFAVIYLQRRFGIAHGLATALLAVIVVGAVSGTVLGGRFTDGLIRRGKINARVFVPAVSYLLACAVLGPAFALTLLLPATVLFILGGIGLTAPNPPLDAARLDIVPSGLWGRAEAARTLVRNIAQGLAPLFFGLLSDHIAKAGAVGGKATGFGASASSAGLQDTFLIMLSALLFSALFMWRARRFYPGDVAAAILGEQVGARSTAAASAGTAAPAA